MDKFLTSPRTKVYTAPISQLHEMIVNKKLFAKSKDPYTTACIVTQENFPVCKKQT